MFPLFFFRSEIYVEFHSADWSHISGTQLKYACDLHYAMSFSSSSASSHCYFFFSIITYSKRDICGENGKNGVASRICINVFSFFCWPCILLAAKWFYSTFIFSVEGKVARDFFFMYKSHTSQLTLIFQIFKFSIELDLMCLGVLLTLVQGEHKKPTQNDSHWNQLWANCKYST